jgi:threonine-phosphate decarboxylase
MSLAHGGNVYETAFRLGCAPEDILDFSASINPLGPPAGLLDEFGHYFHRLQHYPDIRNHSLIEAISNFHDVSPNQVVAGNGSTELIYWLPQILDIDRAAVVLPTFSEYRKAFEIQNIHVDKLITRSEDLFQPAMEQLDSVLAAPHLDAILVTSPGSPSGTLMPAPVRNRLLQRCKESNILCIVDEVFMDFCEEESMKKNLKDYPQLVLIRSMTKFYGIPGLRLGYLLTSEIIASRMRERIPPWSVNTLAQIAGEYCLVQEAYQHDTLQLIESERERLRVKLDSAKGYRVFPGKANYLLLELGGNLPPAPALQQELLASDRILIRDCSSFEGLGDRFVRIAIRLPEENERLLSALLGRAASHCA